LTVYRTSDADTVALLERLPQSTSLVLEHEQAVFLAMLTLKEVRGSFADALIGALGVHAGCAYTFTFDRTAARLPGFQLA
jgi:predicted nucleic-acid-binding protein